MEVSLTTDDESVGDGGGDIEGNSAELRVDMLRICQIIARKRKRVFFPGCL